MQYKLKMNYQSEISVFPNTRYLADMGMCKEFLIQYNGSLTLHENSLSSLGVYEYVGKRKDCETCLGIFMIKEGDKSHYAAIFGNESFDHFAVFGWWGMVRNRLI